MTAKDFLAYVEETTRNELWIDHAAWYLGKDVYITAGVSINYPPYYGFYIRNAKVERLYSVQEYILELWTVDPKVAKPFYLSENSYSPGTKFSLRTVIFLHQIPVQHGSFSGTTCRQGRWRK